MRNHEIARGITHYDSQDLQRIKGVKSEEVANILGFEHGTVVVHRDDLVVVA
jgi:glutamate 5-kinase